MVKKGTFTRRLGERRYKRLFVIVCEGKVTEPQYFSLPVFSRNSKHHILQIKSSNSSPAGLLKRVKSYIQKNRLEKTDQVWIVSDTDEWPDEQLRLLYAWREKQKNFGLALSKPNFEYWLLLHFEDGNKISNKQDCLMKLKKYLPNYEKAIPCAKFTQENITLAVKRARARHQNNDFDNKHNAGVTLVYKLVEQLLPNSND